MTVVRAILRALAAVLTLRFLRRRGQRHVPAPSAENGRGPEGNPRAELLVAGALGAAGLAGAAFVVLYVVLPDTQLLGLTIGLAFALLALACVVLAKRVLPTEEASGEYHDFGDEQSQREVEQAVGAGGTAITRRRLLLGSAGAAGAAVGAAALIPAASLGPNVNDAIYRTPWRRGRRVVTEEGRPILAEDVAEDEFLTGFPEGADRDEIGSPLIIVRIPPVRLRLPANRRVGAPEGILAFSKICPHAGCAISMYRHPRYRPTGPPPALVCPCHYSTFDPERGGHLVFGPAGRDLPQLPLTIDPQRRLLAGGDFYDTVGPSYSGTRLRPKGRQE